MRQQTMNAVCRERRTERRENDGRPFAQQPIYSRYSTITTILVKGVSEDMLWRLKKLKVELDCDTGGGAAGQTFVTGPQSHFCETRDHGNEAGVTEFIAIAIRVSKSWQGPPSVLEEFGSSRKHDEKCQENPHARC